MYVINYLFNVKKIKAFYFLSEEFVIIKLKFFKLI